jgi:hypothetical protein
MMKPARVRRRSAFWLALALVAVAVDSLAQSPPAALPPPPPPPAPVSTAALVTPPVGTATAPLAPPEAAAKAPGGPQAGLAGAGAPWGPTAGAVPPGGAQAAANAPAALSAADAARAALLRKQGHQAFDGARYLDAIAAYEALVKLAPDPPIFFNLAQAYENVGRHADALTSYRRFQESASSEQLARVGNLEQRIAIMRNKVTLLRVNVNVPGARVRVRDVFVGTKLPDRPFVAALDEGRAVVEIALDGYHPYYKEHTLQGGSLLELDVKLNEHAPANTVHENTKTIYVSSQPFWSQWWFWSGLGALVVGGAISTYALSTERSPDDGTPKIRVPKTSGLSLSF